MRQHTPEEFLQLKGRCLYLLLLKAPRTKICVKNLSSLLASQTEKLLFSNLIVAVPNITSTTSTHHQPLPPHGDNMEEGWALEGSSGLYWLETQKLYVDPTSGHFYNPVSTEWYNPQTSDWYRL